MARKFLFLVKIELAPMEIMHGAMLIQLHGAVKCMEPRKSTSSNKAVAQTKTKLKLKPRIQSIRRLSESTKENKQNKNDTKITHCKQDIPFSVF